MIANEMLKKEFPAAFCSVQTVVHHCPRNFKVDVGYGNIGGGSMKREIG